jgi:copper chaperone CopZ
MPGTGRRKVVEAGGRVNCAARSARLEPGCSATFRTMVSVITISGMIAVHSKRAVFTALAGVPGIVSAEVEMGRAVVDHDSSVSDETMTTTVASVGYRVTAIERRRTLPVRGSGEDLDT